MNPLIPIFVVVPLAGAFLIMILGKFFRDLNKYITSLILLFLLIIRRLGTCKRCANRHLYGDGWFYNYYIMHYQLNWFPVGHLFDLLYQPLHFRKLFLFIILSYDCRNEWGCSQRRSL
jgi:hypothetical protein